MRQVDSSDARYVTCARCPQRFAQWTGDRRQILCRDCRYVISGFEREMWEAA